MSLPPRPALLAGREELLADLDARLTGTGPRVVALHGLGGAGKTSVAVEYAHRHLAEVGLAWQFPAEDPALLLAEFVRLAVQLGAREMVDARDPVASVHGVLAVFPADWLLVFDNVLNQQAVQPFLPPAGRGRVLITSQSAAWPAGQGAEVPVLDTEVAAGFLANRTSDPDKQTAEDLAVELGGLPLALEQAAAYIQATGTTLAGYLCCASLLMDTQRHSWWTGPEPKFPCRWRHLGEHLGFASTRRAAATKLAWPSRMVSGLASALRYGLLFRIGPPPPVPARQARAAGSVAERGFLAPSHLAAPGVVTGAGCGHGPGGRRESAAQLTGVPP